MRWSSGFRGWPIMPVVAFGLCLITGLTASFYLVLQYYGYQLSNVDSLLFYSSFVASRRYGSWLDLQTFAFGQGFGSFQFPTLFHPFWWTLDLSGSVSAAYFVSEFSVIAGVYVYTRALKLGSFTALAVAIASIYAFHFGPICVDYFAAIMPQHIMQIGLAYLGLGLVLTAGLSRVRHLLAGWAVLMAVFIMDYMYAMFLLILIGISAVMLAPDLMRKINKGEFGLPLLLAGLVVGSATLIYASGLITAVDSLTLMSLRTWTGLDYTFQKSLLIFGGLASCDGAQAVGIGGLACALLLAVRRHSTLMAPALMVLTAIAAIAPFDIDASGKVQWTLPSLGYFERPLIPLYLIFIVATGRELITWLTTRVGQFSSIVATLKESKLSPFLPAYWLPIWVAAVPVGLVLAFAIMAPPEDWKALWFRLPYYWDGTIAFVREMALPAPSRAAYAPTVFDATAQWSIYNCPHLDPSPTKGRGRYCAYMLNLQAAPVVFEFQNLLDIQNVQMLRQIQRVGQRLEFNPSATPTVPIRTFKSFGIRYVALDGNIDGARHLVLGDHQISLVDLGPVEAADLSISAVQLAPKFEWDAAVTARAAGRAVVHDAPTFNRINALVPVDDVKLDHVPGGMVVQARSAGPSLLLLPFQFSNCLALEGDARDASLIRVNGAQAALLFTRQASLTVRNAYRLFGDVKCRERDFVDVFRLGVWPADSYAEIVGNRRVPLLMRWYLEAQLRRREQLLTGSSH